MLLILSCSLSFPVPVLVCSALAKSRPPSVKKEIISEPVVSEEEMMEVAEPYLGAPYRRGGVSIKGMDCSGLVRRIYSDLFSLEIPHSSAQQYRLPIMEKVSEDELQTGDLIFFSQKKKQITHVGIYLSDGNFIHAARKSGVTISSLDSQYWKIRMVGAKRPVGLERDKDTGPERSFSSVEMALNGSGGLFKGAGREENAFSSLGDGLRPLSWWDISSANSLREGLAQTFEFQLSHSFGEASWRMSLLQESFCQYSSSQGDSLLASRSPSDLSARQYTLTGYRQGVKMASDINPFDWLRITPSFSYVGYERGVQESPCWGPGLGLAVQIRPLPSKWSLAADFQYWDEGNRIDSGLNDLDSWENRNLSLMLGYDLSTDLRLRVVGQHGMGSFFKAKSGPSDKEHQHSGLFFKLDWAF
ncbi:MAG: NlpC/P60 protein [Thermodesulfobacteriota bacterium]|nr:NlpC/P60 protein [Thermodesulfobacteriota bacterium]